MIRSGNLEIQRSSNIGTEIAPLGVTNVAFAQAYNEAFYGIDLSRPYDVEVISLPLIETSIVFCSDGRTETARVITPRENRELGPIRKLVEIIFNDYGITSIAYIEPKDEPFFHISPTEPASPSWEVQKIPDYEA